MIPTSHTWISGIVLAGMAGLFAVAGCGPAEPDEPVIARVAETYITEKEFVDGYARHILGVGVQDSEAQRRDYLDGLINKRLLVMYARDSGLIDRAAEQAALERIRDKLLLDAYTVEVIYSNIEITEADMREMFVRMNTQITARHLYAPTIDEARALRKRLQAGETFEELAPEVFADPELAAGGGSLGTFGFDETDPAFEEAAFELDIGSLSDPVKTAQGYSIIRVDDRFTHPLITESEFNAKRDRVAAYVRYTKRVKARRDHVRSLVDDLDVDFNQTTISQLAEQITAPDGLGESERIELGPSELLTFGPGNERTTWTVSEFRRRALATSTEQRSAVIDETTLRSFAEALIAREVMIDRAAALKLDESETFKKAEAVALEDWAYEHFRSVYREQIDVPEDSIRSYFDRFGDEFRMPERVRVWEILLPTKREADSVHSRARSQPFSDLAADFSTREGAAVTGGDLGYVARDQLGVLADAVFSARDGDIVGPFEVAGRYALLKVGDRRAPRRAEYGEVNDLIKDRLLPIMERRRLVEIVRESKRSIDVTIDWAALYSARLPSNLND